MTRTSVSLWSVMHCPAHRLDVEHYRNDGTCLCCPPADGCRICGDPTDSTATIIVDPEGIPGPLCSACRVLYGMN